MQAANDNESNYDRMKQKVNDELKQHFRPEFLNRIDDIIVFHQLSRTRSCDIVDLMIARMEAQLRNKDMGLELTASAKALLAKKGYDPVLGARSWASTRAAIRSTICTISSSVAGEHHDVVDAWNSGRKCCLSSSSPSSGRS